MRVTGERLTVPITGILPDFPTKLEIEAFDDLQVCKQDAQVKTTRFPLALPRTDTVLYPFLSNANQLVLFLVLKKLNQAIEPNYEFQKILIRFLACGDQLRFPDLPQLSDEEHVVFMEFSMTYTKVFMGHPMTSQTQRSSKLSVQQVFLAQCSIAKKLRINSRPALTLPLSYFTDPEPEVKVRKGTHVLIPHSSLEKID